jgi:predicted RNase H-like HicB family nuclease
MKRFLIIIEKAERSYSAYSPDLAGCIAVGRTKAQVQKNMRAAIKFHLEGLREDGIVIPAARVDAAWVAVE